MKLTRRNLVGFEHLSTATDLLQRIRLEGRYEGLYEAADVQWWWREENGATDAQRQHYWFNEQEQAVACLLLHDRGGEWNNDFFYLPSARDTIAANVVPAVVAAITQLDKVSTLSARDDDWMVRHALEAAGFVQDEPHMFLGELCGEPPKPELPPGFTLSSRVEDTHPHHLMRRNGSEIELRLSECSLYRPDLDLCVRDPDGTVAAYALFWMDKVTSVGLLEPMRTEAAFRRMGLAMHLIAEGATRLRALGADSIRVAHSTDNPAAVSLYHRAGFVPRIKCLEFRLLR